MKNKTNQTIYYQMQRFADITKIFIIQGNTQRAKKCLAKAEELYMKGSSEMKNVVSNIYVYSVSIFMELHNCSIKNLFPESLKSEYLKQVNAIAE